MPFLCGKIAPKLCCKIVSKLRNVSSPKRHTSRLYRIIFQHLVNFSSCSGDFILIPERPFFLHKRNKFTNIQHCYWIGSWTELLDGRKRISEFWISQKSRTQFPVPGPQKSLRHVSWHQMPLDAHTNTHILYTRTPYHT